MKDVIQSGDIVKIIFSDIQNFINYNQSTIEYTGEVLYIPQDVGDMWHFKIDGQIVYINPSNSELKGIILIEKEKEDNLLF